MLTTDSRFVRPFSLAVVAAAGLAILLPAVDAAAAPAANATIRVAHLSPDLPGVDISITSFTGRTTSYVSNAKYGSLGRYEQVPPGSYTFSLRRHGAAKTAPALQTWSLTAKSGYAYTAAEVGVGAQHRGVVLNDNLTPPKRGYSNVRLIQASSRAGTAQVDARGGTVVATDTAFSTSTQYAGVRAGTWNLQASGNGQRAAATVSLQSGSVASLVLLDAPGGGIRLVNSIDAAGAATTPKGSVDAGGGGLAEPHPASRTALASAASGSVAFLALSLLAFAGRRRRMTPIRSS